MSIRPVTVNADGSVEVYYDEGHHGGTLPPAQITWSAQPPSDEPSHKTLATPCPDGCGATSWHPVGGGAAADLVQQLFVDKTTREGCACGELDARTDAAPKAHVRLNVARMDGPERWKLGPVSEPLPPGEEPPPPEPPTFLVVYRDSDGFVLGLDPDGPVDDDLGTAEIDEDLFRELMRTERAYLINGELRDAPA